MPTCRNCHQNITKFDSDFCPYCGIADPIDAKYKTKDMTQFIDPQRPNYKLYKSKSRVAAALLCLFLGWSGAHSFYLGYKKRGIIEFLITLGITALFGIIFLVFCLYEIIVIQPAFGFIASFVICFFAYAFHSIYYFKKDSLKDKNGVFLR